METNTGAIISKHFKLFTRCTSDRWTKTSKTLHLASIKPASIFHLRLKTQPPVAESLPPRASQSHSRNPSELPTRRVEMQTTTGCLSGREMETGQCGRMIFALTDVCFGGKSRVLLPFPDAAAVWGDQNSFCPSIQCSERGAGQGGVGFYTCPGPDGEPWSSYRKQKVLLLFMLCGGKMIVESCGL